ncbi:MAG: hypothetical protein HOP29_17900 [Phycisphaerales bacterium]|nr:hypothetical protein [Phycisphaerales bacterium]
MNKKLIGIITAALSAVVVEAFWANWFPVWVRSCIIGIAVTLLIVACLLGSKWIGRFRMMRWGFPILAGGQPDRLEQFIHAVGANIQEHDLRKDSARLLVHLYFLNASSFALRFDVDGWFSCEGEHIPGTVRMESNDLCPMPNMCFRLTIFQEVPPNTAAKLASIAQDTEKLDIRFGKVNLLVRIDGWSGPRRRVILPDSVGFQRGMAWHGGGFLGRLMERKERNRQE